MENNTALTNAVTGAEVETYLLAKLAEAIDRTKAEDDRSLSCLVDLHSKFTDLKKSLEATRTLLQPEEESKRREILYHVTNLLSEWQKISKKHGFQAPEALYASYKLSKSLKKIKIEPRVGESTGSGHPIPTQDQQEIVETSVPTNLEPYRWSSRFRPTKVHGLEDKIRFMERLLVKKQKDDGFNTIAIVGMTGVGKTALCQVMFNNEKVKNHYQLRLWVCLSKQPNDLNSKKEAVKRILLCLGVEEEVIDKAGQDQDQGLRRLIFALRLQLKDKKYLIVLDDASSEDKFFENLSSQSTKYDYYQQLSYGLPKGEGNMVIVTTRSEEIAKKMVGEENVHHLPLLRKKQLCWEIFKDIVEKDGEFPKELESLEGLVVKKCGGLPLAATMMAEIVRADRKAARAATQQHHQVGRQQTI